MTAFAVMSHFLQLGMSLPPSWQSHKVYWHHPIKKHRQNSNFTRLIINQQKKNSKIISMSLESKQIPQNNVIFCIITLRVFQAPDLEAKLSCLFLAWSSSTFRREWRSSSIKRISLRLSALVDWRTSWDFFVIVSSSVWADCSSFWSSCLWK